MRRASLALIPLLAVVAACSGPSLEIPGGLGGAPWTLRIPAGWHAETARSEAGPRSMTGDIITTYVSNADRRFGDIGASPNSGMPWAEYRRFGSDGVIVLVQHIANRGDGSNEPESGTDRDWGEHADAGSPGRSWTFHAATTCRSSLCYSSLIWWGPDASFLDLAAARDVAASIALD